MTSSNGDSSDLYSTRVDVGQLYKSGDISNKRASLNEESTISNNNNNNNNVSSSSPSKRHSLLADAHSLQSSFDSYENEVNLSGAPCYNRLSRVSNGSNPNPTSLSPSVQSKSSPVVASWMKVPNANE